MDTIEELSPSVPEMITNLNLYGLIEDMAQNPSTQDQRAKDIETVIETITEREKQHLLLKEAGRGDRKGETVLHTAIKLLQFSSTSEKEVLQTLLHNFPKLLYQDRISTEYAGQTPLHMAVAKGNIWVADALLKMMSTKEHRERKSALLKRLAIGTVFTNTVMMAELPLSIAVVTCNKGMFDLLIEYGAELDGTNRQGDNVCHSLIRYALLYPEKLQDVVDMCKYVSEDPAPYDTSAKAAINRKLRKKIWLMENKDGYNPLQLAAKFGQHEIFTFIMNLDVYCCENINDGLFDIKIYDVTEIDAISHIDFKERIGLERKTRVESVIEDVPGRRVVSNSHKSCQRSVLQMLLELEPGCAFQFLLFPPLRRIIDKKWEMYRWYFYPWFMFHFTFMCFLTWYGIERSQQHKNVDDGYDIFQNPIYKIDMHTDAFGIAFGIIDVAIGSVYILEALLRLLKGHMPWTLRSFTNPYGNGTFQIMFVLFGLLLMIDFPLAIWMPSYENYLLIIAILIGWFLFLFFFRALRPFSFFTVMIQKVLIGDLFRFFVILSCELIGFSTAMYMAIQGAKEFDAEFDNFGRVLVSMFKLMVGLGEMGMLYNTRHPVLVILIFFTFIILTTLLMINSLIAMLSRTCTELVENVGTVSARDMHWKLQRLSVVLYVESILPRYGVQCVGQKQKKSRYNNQINKRNKVTRYMMEIRSLQSEDHNNNEDTISASWGFRTAQFNALLHKQASRVERPLSGVRQTLADLLHRGKKNKRKKHASTRETKDTVDDHVTAMDDPIIVEKANEVCKETNHSENTNVNLMKQNKDLFHPAQERIREHFTAGLSKNSHGKISIPASHGQQGFGSTYQNNFADRLSPVIPQVEHPYQQSALEPKIYRDYMSPSNETRDIVHPDMHAEGYRSPVVTQFKQDKYGSPNFQSNLPPTAETHEHGQTSFQQEQPSFSQPLVEKLEIHHISKCRHCSEEEIIP